MCQQGSWKAPSLFRRITRVISEDLLAGEGKQSRWKPINIPLQMGAIEALERSIAKSFCETGGLIGRHPIRVIVFTLLFSAFSSIGLLKFDEANNVRTEYSPINAPSRVEYAVAKRFLGQNGTMDPVYVMVEASDGGSLLRDPHRKSLIDLIRRIQLNISVELDGKVYGYRDLCEPYCEMNTAFMAFLRLFDQENQATYTYPSIDLFGSEAFIGNNVYGVDVEEGTNLIKSFTTALLQLFIVAPENEDRLLFQWQLQVGRALSYDNFPLFKIGITSDNFVSAEVRRMGYETAPMLIGSILAMITFVVSSSFRRNPMRSKPWESLIGSLIPLLALLTSTSMLTGTGLKFQSIVVASYFLVLSVGVDDVFIILRAWDRTPTAMEIPQRLSKALEDAGPSITISSLTNALSFGIGILSATPAVRTFSIYSCFAIIVCYFYQLILFSAVLALSGRREANGNRSLLCCLKAKPEEHSAIIERVYDFQIWVIKTWSTTISKWSSRLILVLVMIVYYYISFIGIKKLEAKISVDRMALPDSYLHDFQHVFENALRNMQPITVFVLNPGDLRDQQRLKDVKSLVHEYENSLYSYGNRSTFFWLEQYEDFLRFYSETDEFTYVEIPTFFKSATYFFLSSFVHMNETACNENDPKCINAFFFVTNFHEVIQYNELIPVVREWRQIAAKYSEYDVYPYSEHSPFVDQTQTIKSTVLFSVLAALCCTATACFIFIPNPVSIGCAVFSVFSISIGIFGLLSHWSVDLDPISMAALLMAIGFSVDFTAHISYHYYKACGKTGRDRLEEALITIGWPMLQVGISTIAALLPLLLKQSYLSMVFLKTVITVVILGVFHGLVVLPALLTAINSLIKYSHFDGSETSESTSQGSHERKESYYRTQKLINAINKEMPFLTGASQANGVRKKLNKANSVAPTSPLDVLGSNPIAYIHRIELGRTTSLPAGT